MKHDTKLKRIVVKVGTSTLTYENGRLNLHRIEHLVRVMSDLVNQGYELVLVTSGAVAVGAGKMGLTARPREVGMRQAAAAVGQCELMHLYDKLFGEYDHIVAQILLTRHDIGEGIRRTHLQNTFASLLATGAIPIVNENDSVAVEEIEALDTFGDNDTLSAVVAQLCHADALVIFTDMDGLFDDDPRKNPNAKKIAHVQKITDPLRHMAGGAGTLGGTGGMATKLSAAELCMEKSIPMWITNGARPADLYSIAQGMPCGTLFCGKERL